MLKHIAALFCLAVSTVAAPLANASPDKGTLYLEFGADPSTLNPITSSDAYASQVQAYVFSSLMDRSEETYEWMPALAEKYTVSKDGKTFTFTLRKGVKWHDGKPVTAEDVKYSFDVYFEGRFDSPQTRVYLEGIEGAKIVNENTIEFKTKQVYFKNFNTIAGLTIIPKHFYGVGDPKDPKFNKQLVGCGPYKLETWEKGQKIVLAKNPEFFGKDLPAYKNYYSYDRILFRPVKEEAVALEMLKKGDLDMIGLTPEQYIQKTKGSEWGTKVEAIKAENAAPNNFNYGFIGWNFKHPFFKDRDVRMAMSHLVNREFMIKKFLFDLSEAAKGPFGNKSSATSPKVKAVEFDSKKALALLEKAGWKMGPKGMTKQIDGKETVFEFTLLNANKDGEKYWTVVKEDMKKLGITMNIKTIEWNSFVKLLDERKFDAVTLGWSVGDLEPDPKQIWHSASIPSPGSNFVGYSNPKVDKLIDEMRASMDAKKRQKMLNHIHELIAEDAPYSFMFNRKYTLYANTKRLKKGKDTLKYAIGVNTWKIEQ
jgi:peptide/nickel transport system substrate-binding protein/microcin C transport system substrate-binding protein